MRPRSVFFTVAACILIVASSTPATANGAVAGGGVLSQNNDCLHDVVLEATGADGTWGFSVESKRQYDGMITPNIISFPKCFMDVPQVHASSYLDEWDPLTGGCLDSAGDAGAELCLTDPQSGSAGQTSYSVTLKNHVEGATLKGRLDLVVVSA